MIYTLKFAEKYIAKGRMLLSIRPSQLPIIISNFTHFHLDITYIFHAPNIADKKEPMKYNSIILWVCISNLPKKTEQVISAHDITPTKNTTQATIKFFFI